MLRKWGGKMSLKKEWKNKTLDTSKMYWVKELEEKDKENDQER